MLNRGVSSDSKGGASAGSASGAEAGTAETPKASGSASGNDNAAASNTAASNDAAAQSADNGIAVQASTEKTLTYFGDEILTKGTVYGFLHENFKSPLGFSYGKYGLGPNGENIDKWSGSSDDSGLTGTEYKVWGSSVGKLKEIGALHIQKQQKSFFEWTDIEGAGVTVLSGAIKQNDFYASNDSDEVKFSVNQVSGVEQTVTRKSKNGESLPIKDEGNGVYSFKADQWSTVAVDYAVAKTSLTVEFDKSAVSVEAFNKPFSPKVADTDIPAKTPASALLTPKGNYAVTSAVLKDNEGNETKLELAFTSADKRAASAAIPALDAGKSYTLAVETKECKLAVKDNPSAAVGNVDPSLFEQRVIEGVLDLENSVPSNISASELEITYLAGTGLFTGED